MALVAVEAPPRLGLVPRGTTLLAAMAETFPVRDTPFFNAVAEIVYCYIWAQLDNNVLCPRCVVGLSAMAVYSGGIDYYHFCGEKYKDLVEIAAKRTEEYIEHVHRDHPPGGPEHKIVDAGMMSLQAVYLDILHNKADRLQFPNNEERSIRYRLVNSATRTLALQVRSEQCALTAAPDDVDIDAVGFAGFVMHDICDCRHDNCSNEFYNFMTIVSAHQGKSSVNMVRRLCIDVWAWAVDNGEDWALHYAGRVLAWQVYVTRYQTALLLDNLHEPDPVLNRDIDPYGDEVLNGMNPLKTRSPNPFDFDVRSRCQNKKRYDELRDKCLEHFQVCPGCDHYHSKALLWQDWIGRIGSAYAKKYTDCTCLNMISTYMVLSPLTGLWWLSEPTAKYTGPKGEWSIMLD